MDPDSDRTRKPGKLHKIIIGTSGFLAVILALFFFQGQPEPVLPALPWFILLINSFTAITFFAVAFLAIGRHNVVRDPSSFWIGLGAAGFGVALAFRTLSWPGLLDNGGSLIGSLPGTTTWFLQFGITILGAFLLISAVASRPRDEDLAHGRLLLLSGAWMVFLAGGFIIVMAAEQRLPSLVDPNGTFQVPFLVWNGAVAILFTAGTALSTRRYANTGDPLLGYMAIAQAGFAFTLFITLVGIRRYDLVWYLTRAVQAFSSLIFIFGLLYENVQLLRREKDSAARVRNAIDDLRFSQDRFRLLVSASSEVLYRMNPDWSEMRQLHGQGFLANTEKPNRNWLQEYIHPDDQPQVTDVIKQAIRNKSTFVLEHRVRCLNGTLGWTISRAVPLLDENGEIVEWFGAATNITDRKTAEQALRESEERFRLAASAGNIGAYSRNLQTGKGYWSPEFLAIYGHGPDEPLPLEDGIPANVHPEDRPRVLAEAAARLDSTAKPEFSSEHRIILSNGEIRWVMIRGRMEFDTRGKPLQSHGIVMDITERKQSEKALEQLNETLEQRVAERSALAEARAKQLQSMAIELIETEERERRRFAELLHDDLQQMLASARFQLQAVSGDKSAEPELENIARILEASIVKSRRLSHEISPPEMHYGSLYSAIQWLTEQMSEQFGLGVNLKAENIPELKDNPIKVFLFRAVQEFLFNIVKHSGVKTAEVLISAKKGQLEVTVSDKGKGFVKGDLEHAKTRQGFGLLSIRERALHIGGRLEIEGEPGRGSRFSLTVPIRPAVEEGGDTTAQTSLRAVARKPHSGEIGLRVLFADDHKVMRQGLIRLISGQSDIQVAGEAANGKEAIELALQLRPDVIVMDISMPEMDGIEATRRIKTELPDVRVIGLSMYEDKHSAQNILKAGADTFVPKTASSAELLKAIYGSDVVALS